MHFSFLFKLNHLFKIVCCLLSGVEFNNSYFFMIIFQNFYIIFNGLIKILPKINPYTHTISLYMFVDVFAQNIHNIYKHIWKVIFIIMVWGGLFLLSLSIVVTPSEVFIFQHSCATGKSDKWDFFKNDSSSVIIWETKHYNSTQFDIIVCFLQLIRF